jgi:uncharacterized OsmC-like protein
MGPSALELSLMSLAGCYATIFALTARKMRMPLNILEVKAEGVKSEEAGTIVETRFDIWVKTKAPEDRAQRCHQLTARDCPVGKISEKAGVRISYNLKIEK